MRLNHIVVALAVVACLQSQDVQASGNCGFLCEDDTAGKSSLLTPEECLGACTTGCLSSSIELCHFEGVSVLPPPVPAVSEWGIASLGLLLIAGLTIKFRGALPKPA